MTILIVGSGAVGSFFGARLHAAGHDVRFVARGARHRVLAERGIGLVGAAGRQHFAVHLADAPQQWDAVLLCVKAWQMDAVLATLPLPQGWNGVALTLQNGIEAPARAAALLGRSQVLAGVVHGFFRIDGDGTVHHVGVPPHILIGALDGRRQGDVERLRAVIEQAGIAAETAPDIIAVLWAKLLLAGPLGAVGAIARLPVGAIRSDPVWRGMIEDAMREIAMVAAASGIDLAADIVATTLAYVDGFPADATTSMQRDLMAGRTSEFDAQIGAAVRAARAGGVPAPTLDAMIASLSQ